MERNVEILIQELNQMLNRIVRENRELKGVIRAIHSMGYNVQISFTCAGNEKGTVTCTGRDEPEDKSQLNLSREDYMFLKSIRITSDD